MAELLPLGFVCSCPSPSDRHGFGYHCPCSCPACNVPKADTSNRQTVRPIIDGVIGFQPTSTLLTEDQAINLAAWLVAMVPGGRRRFDAMLSDILNT